jgi:N utilization substance protein B
MGKRREGREAAVQFLYQTDLNRDEETSVDALLGEFWKLRETSGKTRDFATVLVHGVLKNREAIDERIKKLAANYELHRIAPVDRNILRLAIYEIVFTEDVPPVVCINEAIEIAKRFGSEESGRFVNGILDRVKEEATRPLR